MAAVEGPLLRVAQRLSAIVSQLARDIPKFPHPYQLRAIDAMNHATRALSALTGREDEPDDLTTLREAERAATWGGRREGAGRKSSFQDGIQDEKLDSATISSSSPKDSPNGKEETASNKTPSTGKTRASRSTDSPAFLRFWTFYPKKVGKDEARRAWIRRDLDSQIDEILNGLEKNRAYLIRDGGQFIPNPATWLNQGRWQDEPPVVTTPLLSPKTEGNRAAAKLAVDMIKKGHS